MAFTCVQSSRVGSCSGAGGGRSCMSLCACVCVSDGGCAVGLPSRTCVCANVHVSWCAVGTRFPARPFPARPPEGSCTGVSGLGLGALAQRLLAARGELLLRSRPVPTRSRRRLRPPLPAASCALLATIRSPAAPRGGAAAARASGATAKRGGLGAPHVSAGRRLTPTLAPWRRRRRRLAQPRSELLQLKPVCAGGGAFKSCEGKRVCAKGGGISASQPPALPSLRPALSNGGRRRRTCPHGVSRRSGEPVAAAALTNQLSTPLREPAALVKLGWRGEGRPEVLAADWACRAWETAVKTPRTPAPSSPRRSMRS